MAKEHWNIAIAKALKLDHERLVSLTLVLQPDSLPRVHAQYIVIGSDVDALTAALSNFELRPLTPDRSTCKAVQMSDMMVCNVCNLSWDVNDPLPPMCHTPPAAPVPSTFVLHCRALVVWLRGVWEKVLARVKRD